MDHTSTILCTDEDLHRRVEVHHIQPGPHKVAGKGTGFTYGQGSPMERGSTAERSAHISKSFQGRAPSKHIDVHLIRGDGDEDEYDDDETQP